MFMPDPSLQIKFKPDPSLINDNFRDPSSVEARIRVHLQYIYIINSPTPSPPTSSRRVNSGAVPILT